MSRDYSETNPYVDKMDRWSSHAQFLNLLSSFPPKTTILDVGSASGTLGRHTRERNFEWYGIEPQAKWSQEAAPYYKKIINAGIEDVPNEFLQGYQVVICGDVLEHLPDPEAVLMRLVNLQSQGAFFLLSVPNVANIWVRINLLFGHFDYTNRGILDYTHLRFFTRTSFLWLVQEAGLKVQRIHVTPIPLNLIHPFFDNNPIGRFLFAVLAALTSMFPTLLGYQWIAFARKESDERE